MLLFYSSIYTKTFHVEMYVYYDHIILHRSEDSVHSAETKVTGDHKLPCGCWEPNLVPLQEQ